MDTGPELRANGDHIVTVHLDSIRRALRKIEPSLLEAVSEMLRHSLAAGGRIFVIGNGGSSAQAQHFAAEAVGHFPGLQKPVSVLALTTDTSIMTSVANDLSFDEIFSRQILAHGTNGDVLMALSTSGESRNIIEACSAARSRNIKLIALTGALPNTLASLADIATSVDESDPSIVQDVHQVCLHLICKVMAANSEDAG